MTTDQILLGVGLTLSLAVGCQILASRLRIPALIVLLPVGFVAGALTEVVNPDQLLGPLFEPLVSLAVAVILFDSGLGLDLRKLQGHTRRVVRRLIVIGVPVTWALATVSAMLLLGMSKQSAIMLGAILIVSGPTVVGPLLRFVRPTERIQRVLIWEGSLIDPVGAIVGALTFHAVVASSPGTLASGIERFLASVGVGLAGPWVVDLGRALRSAGLDVLMWAGVQAQRDEIIKAGLELAPGELLAAATSRGAELEGVTAVLLLTGEDDFNALASTTLQANLEGAVYRVPAPQDSHGVVAPYTGAEVLFGDPLTGFAINQRHHRGAAIVTRPAEDTVPDGYDLLFLIRPDGQLIAVTKHSRLAPEDGDTLVLLGPATQAANAPPTPSD